MTLRSTLVYLAWGCTSYNPKPVEQEVSWLFPATSDFSLEIKEKNKDFSRMLEVIMKSDFFFFIIKIFIKNFYLLSFPSPSPNPEERFLKAQ